MRGKLTYSNVMSTIAVFLALAGGSFAVAAAFEKDSVKSKQVKDESLKEVDLAPTEALHEIGAPGEPAFGNGAEGDCLWSDGGVVNSEVGFYRDVSGRVHLSGVAAVEDGPQGDGACMDGPSEQMEDMRAFTLPAGYRPSGPEQFFTGSFAHGASVVVNGTDEINIAGSQVAPGEVIIIPTIGSEIPEGVPLGSVSFDAD
ncbi:MAG: hypothetical protein QOI31_672 [Solirubrobacterales bacterium]|jgi:hypothetical protein|nr:hypothetical protein [Solirubrobacterales bacterium]